MRPSEPEAGTKLYECFDCGARANDPERTTCPDCGGDLQHLGRSRDL